MPFSYYSHITCVKTRHLLYRILRSDAVIHAYRKIEFLKTTHVFARHPTIDFVSH